MWKRQLRHINVKSVENISRRNKNHQTRAKKYTCFKRIRRLTQFQGPKDLEKYKYSEWLLKQVTIHISFGFYKRCLKCWELQPETEKKKKLVLVLQMFSNVTFYLETISTNRTYTTLSIWLFMWKRQLRHCNVKSVNNISRKTQNHKTCAKKALIFCWFVFGDFNISNIF